MNVQIHRKDRDSFGGGVLIAIRNGIRHTLISINIVLAPLEVVAVHIQAVDSYNKDVILMCIYIPPSQTRNAIDPFCLLLSYLQDSFPRVVILLVGDFNFPDVDWSSNGVKGASREKSLHHAFLNCLREFSLEQMVKCPTHCLGNTLDLVLSNESAKIENVTVINPGLSDHYLVSAELKLLQTKSRSRVKSLKLYDKLDKELINKHLTVTLTKVEGAIADSRDIDVVWGIFQSDLHAAVDLFVPTREVKHKDTREPPWFNREARKAVKRQRELYNRYKKSRNDGFLFDYKQVRRVNKKLFRKMEYDHFLMKICKPLEDGQSKPFYSYLKQYRGQSSPLLTPFNVDSEDSSGVIAVADRFNDFFHSVFHHPPISLPEAEESTNSLLISESGVLKLLRELKTGKAAGPDNIRKEDLHIDIHLVARILTNIFQFSTKIGKIPTIWKVANVVPIHKKGDKCNPTNYRPVSLTSICCKMLEHIILSNLNSQLENVLHPNQHGFRKGLSCTTQLVSTVHDIMSIVDKEGCVHAAVLDFSKAFDKVSHSLLLQKLSKLNLDRTILRWIHGFLSNRKQRVVIEGFCSGLLDVTSGVPQGSVLGPTLFLLYINDAYSHINFSSMKLFADDILIFKKIEVPRDASRFQKDLLALSSWAKLWKMAFNIDKCHAVAFGSGNLPVYYLEDRQLSIVRSFKYLGVEIAHDFSWESHITSISSKAFSTLGMLRRALHRAPVIVKLTAYKSLCRPALEYACEVWDPFLMKHKELLESVQSRAARFVLDLRGISSVSAAKIDLGLDLLEERRRRSRVRLFNNILGGPLSDNNSLSQLADCCTHDTTHFTRSAARAVPYAVTTNNSFYQNSFIPRTSRDLRNSQI
jgi:hypothetical protein